MEKPTWGQVFSDRINTGIYVIEPWVLDEIPEGAPYDFSAELFPKLMEQGHAIYGTVVEGYWCDVGSQESYLQVHRDILDGRAMIYIPGVHAREYLWVSESAQIDPAATLGEKVVIGENVAVRAGAVVGDYTVVGDNCVIGNDARVGYSVLWDESFVGKQATVSGAILCRRVDVRARAVVDVGAVIGSESLVGHGAHVNADVHVYPYKRVEAAATLSSSLIWESTGARSLFAEAGIAGLVGIDITPELALRVAEAYGSLLPKGAHVVVTRDTSKAARMVKRAMVAGLNAAGINVRDLRVATPAVSRFTTQKTRSMGGIHVAALPGDAQSLEIRFFDKHGLDISPAEQRKVERLYFRGEFRRAFFDAVGEIIYPPRPLEYYSAALEEVIGTANLQGGWRKVVADMSCGAGSLSLPLVANGWMLKVITLNPVVDVETAGGCGEPTPESLELLRGTCELFGADLGVVFDQAAERVRFAAPDGTLLDGDTALHLVTELWCRTRGDVEGAIAVPLTATLAVDTIAERYGRRVIRPGRSRRALAQAVLDGRAVFAGGTMGGYIFGEFFPAFDGVLTVGMVARMLDRVGQSLEELVDGLPAFHKAHVDVFCPDASKGAVMRAISEAAEALGPDLTEGVRVPYDDGWALVLPDSSEPTVNVWAEGSSAGAAWDRVSEWQHLVEQRHRRSLRVARGLLFGTESRGNGAVTHARDTRQSG